MGDVFRKVRSGQPLRIPAAAYNAFVDAAVDLRRRERNANAGPALEPAQRGIVLVRNDSDDDIEPYHALAITGVLVQPDTRIVVAGNNSSGAIVARYLATGAPDPAFGTGGVVQYPGYLDLRGANALARQSDGKLIVVGNLIDEFSFPATHYGALRRQIGRAHV